MTVAECGETIYAGRRARVDIGPCRRPAGVCGPEHRMLEHARAMRELAKQQEERA